MAVLLLGLYTSHMAYLEYSLEPLCIFHPPCTYDPCYKMYLRYPTRPAFLRLCLKGIVPRDFRFFFIKQLPGYTFRKDVYNVRRRQGRHQNYSDMILWYYEGFKEWHSPISPNLGVFFCLNESGKFGEKRI